MIWVDQIIQGVLLGGYYALIACGLSFMFGVMRIVNLAHGSFAVLAAFGLWELASRFGVSPFLGLIVILPAMAAVGWVLQRFVLERSVRGGPLVPLLSTFGLAIMIDNLLFERYGADTRSLAPYLDTLSYDSWTLTDETSSRQFSCSAGCNFFCPIANWAERSARPRRTRTRSACSASMPAG
jgi:branched-chain amino acid transport system permease protein